VDVFEKPDYILRHIAGSVTPEWCLCNRTSPVLGWQNASALPHLPGRWTSSLVQNHHNWGAIIGHSKEEFEAHPEYLGLVTFPVSADTELKPPEADGIDWDTLIKGADRTAPAGEGGEGADLDALAKGHGRPAPSPGAAPAGQAEETAVTTQQRQASSKLCVSNPRVRELASRYALDYFAEKPEQPSVSMEPTDGSGWCECRACEAVGPPSERVALLANSVAEALEEDFPEKYVGILAYHLHADPPSRKLHPRVGVSLATALSGSTPLADRLAGWAKVSGNLGVEVPKQPEERDLLMDTPFTEAGTEAVLEGKAVMTVPQEEMPSLPAGAPEDVPAK
jgi:hypothetical protein